MKMFGSDISYLTIDLIGIWKTSDEHDFAEKRDRYLSTEKPPDAFYSSYALSKTNKLMSQTF